MQGKPTLVYLMQEIRTLPCLQGASERSTIEGWGGVEDVPWITITFCARISSTAVLVYELCLLKFHFEKKKEDKNGFLGRCFPRLPRTRRYV